MAGPQSRRCSMCSIHFPMSVEKCPSCDGALWYSQTEPDELWQWRAESIRQTREAAQHRDYIRETFGHDPIDVPYMVIPLFEVVEGKAWTARVMDVYNHENSKRILKAGDLIEVPDGEDGSHLYEVSGPSFHPTDGSGAKYLLHRMAPGNFFPPEWVEEFQHGD